MFHSKAPQYEKYSFFYIDAIVYKGEIYENFLPFPF